MFHFPIKDNKRTESFVIKSQKNANKMYESDLDDKFFSVRLSDRSFLCSLLHISVTSISSFLFM